MPILTILKVFLLAAVLAGMFVTGPAQSQSWFTWDSPKKGAEQKLYITPGQKPAKSKTPVRTWSQYLFGGGGNDQASQKVIYNRTGPQMQKNEKRITDHEVHSARELIERGRSLTLVHQVGLMKLAASDRKNIFEAQRRHKIRMIELHAKSRRATQAALKGERDIGAMSTAPEGGAGEAKVIYNRPGTVKPQKVFTDYQ